MATMLASALPQPTHQVVTFDEILSGAVGDREAKEARRWLAEGSFVTPMPRGLVYSLTSRAYQDTRINPPPKRQPSGRESPHSVKEEDLIAETRPRPVRTPAARPAKPVRASTLGPAGRRSRAPSSLGLPQDTGASPSPGPSGSSGAGAAPSSLPDHACGAASRVTQGFPASGARVEAGEPPAARESTATGPPAAAERTVPEQAECQPPPMQGPVLQNFPAAGLQGWPDLAQAPGWSFRLDMYGYPLFISPEGYCCHSWEEVQSTVNSLPRLRTQKAQRTLAWIREAAATSSGGRLMHPANLAKMMALQRLRAATFAEEGRLRSFRTAAVQSTLARPASGRAGSAKTPSPPTGSKRRKSTAPQEAHAG
ncbi:hypothetical protein ACKKBF_B31195 [Auxenochlorella protothecoides x Auxenochlorella symbiontica]